MSTPDVPPAPSDPNPAPPTPNPAAPDQPNPAPPAPPAPSPAQPDQPSPAPGPVQPTSGPPEPTPAVPTGNTPNPTGDIKTLDAPNLPANWKEQGLPEKMMWLASQKLNSDKTVTLEQCYLRSAMINKSIHSMFYFLKIIKDKFFKDTTSTVGRTFLALLKSFTAGAVSFANQIALDLKWLLAHGQFNETAVVITVDTMAIDVGFDTQFNTDTASDIWNMFGDILDIMMSKLPWLKDHNNKIGAAWAAAFNALKEAGMTFFETWTGQKRPSAKPKPDDNIAAEEEKSEEFERGNSAVPDSMRTSGLGDQVIFVFEPPLIPLP